MTANQEKEIAEVVLRTRRWAFRDALPEILGTVRRVAGRVEESRRGAEKMIADYRTIIAQGSTE
jgi:hypothetical protein